MDSATCMHTLSLAIISAINCSHELHTCSFDFSGDFAEPALKHTLPLLVVHEQVVWGCVGDTHISDRPVDRSWRSIGINVEFRAPFCEAYLSGRSDSWTGQDWTEGFISLHFIHDVLPFSLFLSAVGNQRRQTVTGQSRFRVLSLWIATNEKVVCR